MEDLDDNFQPEIVNVCTEKSKHVKLDTSNESRRNMVTIKKNWNTGCVTFIRNADDDEVIFLEEIKSK